MMIKCPECGKDISNKSGKCVYCGFPLKKNDINISHKKKKEKA